MVNDIYQTGPVEGRYTPAVSLAGSITPMSSLAGSITPMSSLEGKVAVPKIKEIITVNTKSELPAEGNRNYIYRVRQERSLYQWNPDTRKYESFVNKQNAYSSLTKIKDYFYRLYYTDIDDDYAIEYFKTKKPIVDASGCTSFVKDGKYVRLFDWKYDDNVEFLVNTPRRDDKNAVTGVSASLPLYKEFVEGEYYSDLYKLAPYYLTDGFNEHGLVMSTNVVPMDYGKTTGTTPLIEKRAEICTTMLIRYVLERCKTPDEVVNLISNYISVFAPKGLHDLGFEQHFMVSDGTTTYCIEFIDNQVKVAESDIMTNFFLFGVDLSGLIYTPADVPFGHLPSSQGITPYGEGLERYNLVKSSNREPELIAEQLLYTNTYKRATSPFWYSEYVGGELTVDSAPADFADRVDSYIAAFERRTRKDENPTWQTVHCSIYDFAEKNLVVKSQEEIGFNGPYYCDKPGGDFPYVIGNTLKVEDNVLDVRTAPNVEKDNTLPITSAAVYTEVGNINALLATI